MDPDKTPAVLYGKRLKRNAIAQDLRTPKYAPRVIKSKRIYSRKRKESA
jgi:hypothetical protein